MPSSREGADANREPGHRRPTAAERPGRDRRRIIAAIGKAPQAARSSFAVNLGWRDHNPGQGQSIGAFCR